MANRLITGRAIEAEGLRARTLSGVRVCVPYASGGPPSDFGFTPRPETVYRPLAKARIRQPLGIRAPLFLYRDFAHKAFEISEARRGRRLNNVNLSACRARKYARRLVLPFSALDVDLGESFSGR